jgi:hypothetical protein
MIQKKLANLAHVIDGPMADMPAGRFGANSAWILCAGFAQN